MKRIILALSLAACVFSGCKKDNTDDDNNGGGGNGGGSGEQDFSGHYIIKTQELCPAGVSYFIGFLLSNNLVDHNLAMTKADTLNSWYLKKTGTDKYMVYAKLGSQFLLWRLGAENLLFNQPAYKEFQVKLELVAALPADPVPDQQFLFTEKTPGSFSVKASNGYYLKTFKGGKKNTTQCSVSGLPNLRIIVGCIDHQENADIIVYCFQEELFFQKIN